MVAGGEGAPTFAPLSVAPMMDRTDRHFRFMMRRITRRTLLYTEMVTAQAILHGKRDILLAYDPEEHPIALQLGGDEPAELAECARIAEDLGYDEVNLNCGCPSDRVQSGRFGACLMARPERVAEAVAAMRARVAIPVTVKHRIGIDDLDRYEDMLRFVDVVASAGCRRFTVHARKAWLSGLSPRENRTVPPLRYPEVHRLKRERPHLGIELNGGILTLDEAEAQRAHVDAVMIGRAAYDTPMIFAEADRRFFGEAGPEATPEAVVEGLLGYTAAQLAAGRRLHHVSRHLVGLFAGRPGTKAFKRHLATHGHAPGAGVEVLREALAAARGAREREEEPEARAG
jgi:tRNA-dihydrouridine synthase A